ncbi:MAG: hypothetical protein JW769_00850 [Parachlamydiales bacterium]|nr:hypothetical protein [Parachlamydiales bacterium]
MNGLRRIGQFFRDKEILFFQWILIVFSGYCIWHSEGMQKMISPKGYWENKISELENHIEVGQHRLKILEISLQKTKATIPFKIEEAEQKASLEGNAEEMIHCITENCQHKIQKLQEDIEKLVQEKKEEEQALKEAQQHLQECQQNTHRTSKNICSKA